jgi:hypothetical protein
LFSEAAPGFPNERVFQRALALGLGLLSTSERHTVTGMLSAIGWTDRDWSAFYRVFSRDQWSTASLFDVAKQHILARLPATAPVVAALDDTKLRKTGPKIPGVSYQRDPMSPPFRPNLIRAQRFCQISMSARFDFDRPSPTRSIPVDFRHAPPPRKLPVSAPPEQKRAFRTAQRTGSLSQTGLAMIHSLRADVDRLGHTSRDLVICGDGSYTNEVLLKNLPARTTLIGRIRKDAKFFHLPVEQPLRGRKRQYGSLAPTPEQLLRDESVPWLPVEVFASGRVHVCQVKTLAPVLWQKAGSQRPLRVVVIRPLRYRLTRTARLLYRQPAYLVCTDPSLPLEQLVQHYFSRWDIEVNHRDEKQLIGVGQAQVRAPRSVERVPAFAVAMYSLLLVAHGECYGFDAIEPATRLPKWRNGTSSPRFRVPTAEMLADLRLPLISRAIADQPNFAHFDARLARSLKLPKSEFSLARAIEFATT